jgi:hypothetical protein
MDDELEDDDMDDEFEPASLKKNRSSIRSKRACNLSSLV